MSEHIGHIPNRNGRIYSGDCLKRAVEEFNKKRAQGRTIYGELEPPGDGKTSLRNVSHEVLGLEHQPDGSVKAQIKFLDTEPGKIAQRMLELGMDLPMSVRGLGVMDGDVVEDMDIISVDFVTGPLPEIDVITQLGELSKEDEEE